MILNIPFWHPESFVMSAERKKKKRCVRLLFSYEAQCWAVNEQVNPFRGCKAPGRAIAARILALQCGENCGTTGISLMNNRIFSSPIGILTKQDGKTCSHTTFLPL